LEYQVNDDQRKLADDFVKAAERYCALVEKVHDLDHTTVLSQFQLLLPEIIRAAASFPPILLQDSAAQIEQENDVPSTSDSRQFRWNQIYVPLKEALGNDSYWDVFDSQDGGEAIRCSFSIDIYEIYEDLKEALAIQEKKNETNMLWDWRYSFYSHWGRHAVAALKAIHQTLG
jgi:hypothetical protein